MNRTFTNVDDRVLREVIAQALPEKRPHPLHHPPRRPQRNHERLLQLNHKLYAEEEAKGLHKPKKAGKKKQTTTKGKPNWKLPSDQPMSKFSNNHDL